MSCGQICQNVLSEVYLVPFIIPQLAITCLKLSIEVLEQGVKYVQS